MPLQTPALLLPAVALVVSLGCGHTQHWPDAAPADKCAAGAFSAEPYVVDVKMPNRTRTALVWVPEGAGPYDLVVNLHEFRADPLRQAHYSGWLPFAKAQGIMLVVPDGKAATWNAGVCCGAAHEQGIDDLAFLDALVARLDDVGCTSGRVLATGIGNGGMMAEQWACSSDVPDAVVSVGGSLQAEACPQGRPVAYLHYHGGADTFIPADGSAGSVPGGLPGSRHFPVEHATNAWVARNQGGLPAQTVQGDLTCTAWQGKAPMASCVIAGGLDTWPGSANGKVASDAPLADATAGAWAWVSSAWDAPPPAEPEPEPQPEPETQPEPASP